MPNVPLRPGSMFQNGGSKEAPRGGEEGGNAALRPGTLFDRANEAASPSNAPLRPGEVIKLPVIIGEGGPLGKLAEKIRSKPEAGNGSKPEKKTPKPKDKDHRPGLVSRTIATGIVLGRELNKRRQAQGQPPPEPLPQEKPDVRASIEASEARIRQHLTEKYGGTPISDVGALPEIVKARSVIASIPPDKWETEASRRLEERLQRLRHVQAVQEQRKKTVSELDALSRNPISSKNWPTPTTDGSAPAQGFWRNAWRIAQNVGGVMARPITSRVQIAITEGRLDQKDTGRVDDYIVIHRDGVSVWNPSEHRGEKRIPWADLGHYEIESGGTHWFDDVNTALAEMGQPREYPGRIGYVKITDPRQRGEVEVIAYTADPEGFVRQMRRVQAMTKSLAQPVPEEVAIPHLRDFIPVPYFEGQETGGVADDTEQNMAWMNYQQRYPHARKTQNTMNDALDEWRRFGRGLPAPGQTAHSDGEDEDDVVDGEFREA